MSQNPDRQHHFWFHKRNGDGGGGDPATCVELWYAHWFHSCSYEEFLGGWNLAEPLKTEMFSLLLSPCALGQI